MFQSLSDESRFFVESKKIIWNKIPEQEKEKIVALTLENPEESPRELAWHITDKYG